MKKGLFILSAFTLVFGMFMSCGSHEQNNQPEAIDAKSVFESNCVLCHGGNGRAMLAGATDLTLSRLDTAGIKNVVKNGRGNMAEFGTKLTEAELEAVVKYVYAFQIK
ncbi:MAG: cytochrome c variant [Bacteroidetes bacterium]|nr:MAG: cytochrome c variant [Bacteroidota bacterium]